MLGGNQAQCLGMTNFTDLVSVPSDSSVPFTDQLRLTVAAYLARSKGASRDHNPGLPSLAYSRPLRGSLPARRRSGGCVIAAGPIIRYPRVAACEQYQVPGGDDAGEVDDELEG